MSDLVNGAEDADKNATESDTAQESVASAAAASAPEEKPATPDNPEASNVVEDLKKKAHDLDAVRKSVEDAASISGTLWFSYLFTLLYIAIATGAVTHKDLLLENPVKLPFLNVELPLVAFFALAPILFIIAHAYTLMHFVMLAAKVGTYDTELREKLSGKDADATHLGLRRQLPSNIFVQFLAGPSDIREGWLGWLLKLVAWISLVIGPVLLLLLLQIQFLPYHLWWVTWVQRCALLADLILLWFLWAAVLECSSEITFPRFWHSRGLTALALLSLVPIGLAFTAATFPGEWLDEHVGNKEWIPPKWLGQEDWTSVHNLLFNGAVDEFSRRRGSFFSNTLVLPGFDAIEARKIDDPKKLTSVAHTLLLRGRHLENAVFDDADLRKADFAGAYLQGASFDYARLEGALFDRTQLQDAHLFGARLQGANFTNAYLQGAELSKAHLQNARLNSAELQGAALEEANLQGALLIGANLQGVDFENAELEGTLVDDAALRGAWLYGAQLQGARLNNAELQGASLISSQLQGTSLEGAQLQGADFGGSALVGTNLRNATVWRTTFDGASFTSVYEDGLKETALSKGEFAALKAKLMEEMPKGENREQALKRIETLNPDTDREESVQEMLKNGRAKNETEYRSAMADHLKSLFCNEDENAAYIVRGFIANDRILEMGAQAPGFVEAILKPDCLVSAALTEADRSALKRTAKVAARAPVP